MLIQCVSWRDVSFYIDDLGSSFLRSATFNSWKTITWSVRTDGSQDDAHVLSLMWGVRVLDHHAGTVIETPVDTFVLKSPTLRSILLLITASHSDPRCPISSDFRNDDRVGVTTCERKCISNIALSSRHSRLRAVLRRSHSPRRKRVVCVEGRAAWQRTLWTQRTICFWALILKSFWKDYLTTSVVDCVFVSQSVTRAVSEAIIVDNAIFTSHDIGTYFEKQNKEAE